MNILDTFFFSISDPLRRYLQLGLHTVSAHTLRCFLPTSYFPLCDNAPLIIQTSFFTCLAHWRPQCTPLVFPPDNIHVTVIFTSFSSKLQLISTSIPSGIFVYVQRVDIFKRQFSSINHKVVCLTPILYNSSLPPPHKASIFSVVNPFLRSFISVLMPLKSSALIHQNFFVSIVLCNTVSMIHNVVIAVDHPFVVSGGSGQISRKEGVFQSKGISKRR